MIKILYDGEQIRNAVLTLMSRGKGRRVAISAFVGEGATDYLGRTRGIEVYCWPKAGGTNPDELESLISAGAIVRIADRMHMKVYWAAGLGTVIASANLSNNALGSGGLKELGVLLPARAIDIDRVIRSIGARKVTTQDITELVKEHRKLPPDFRPRSDKTRTFAQWHSEWLKNRQSHGWKIIAATKRQMTTPTTLRELMNERYGKDEPANWAAGCRGVAVATDFILSYWAIPGRPLSPEWIYADHIWAGNAVQLLPSRRCPAPPFVVKERRFAQAFAKARRKFGSKTLDGWASPQPPPGFIECLRQAY